LINAFPNVSHTSVSQQLLHFHQQQQQKVSVVIVNVQSSQAERVCQKGRRQRIYWQTETMDYSSTRDHHHQVCTSFSNQNV
jgi:hypothetical protein